MKIGAIRSDLRPYIEWLGLDKHWEEIEVRWAKKGEVPDDEEGNVSWQIDHRKATILLQRHFGLRTAVHELWHIRLEGHRENPLPRNPHYEATIWHLTDALMRERIHERTAK